MIKNFVVKVKPIKFEDRGLRNFLNYLEDEKRHKNGIIKIKQFDKDRFFKNTILNIAEYQINKKAGRKSKNYADSYIFTIPPNLYEKISNDKKVLKDILKTLIDNIYEELREDFPDLKKNELTKQLFVNIHTDKKHIHINVIFPRVFRINELKSNRTTGRKKFLNNIKKHWNANLLKNLNISINDYKPATKFKKGYKNKYLKKEIEKIIELKNLLDKKRKEIKEALSKLEEKNVEKEEIVKKITLVIRYYKKLKEYIDKQEKEKAKQEYFKAKNKIKQIEKHKLGKTTKKILNQIKGDLNSYDFGM